MISWRSVCAFVRLRRHFVLRALRKDRSLLARSAEAVLLSGARLSAGKKTTRPFLRSREFWWQEGHTVHATAEEAMEETLRMLNIYAKFFEEWLAIPVVKGEKTEKERFAGAENTYTIEAMMHDCKALQSGTSHYFGDGFARAFGMQYTDKNNTLQYMYQTSWGVSTRIIGAIIMTHGDNEGLVLPPRIAPTQLVVIPVAAHKEGVKEKATELYEQVKAAGIRAKIDLSDNTPGWKFAEYEMKGIPLRLEVGPRDIAEGQCVLVRRDTREKRPLLSSRISKRPFRHCWRISRSRCMRRRSQTARRIPTLQSLLTR